MVFTKPKFAPDAINIKLLGPGVIEDTNAKAASANISSIDMDARIAQNPPKVLALFRRVKEVSQQMTAFDKIDRMILQTLESDGRISNADLAQTVGLSPSACLRRVQELERRGVIKGYRAVLDRAAMGTGFVAYVAIGLSEHTKAAQQEFEAAMAVAPEVRECHNVTGSVEYLLRTEAPNLTEYKKFHTEVLGKAPHLHSIVSYIVMGSPKDDRG